MAPLYSRYVPPKLAQSQDEPRIEVSAPAQLQRHIQEDSSNGRKKRKRNEGDDADRKATKHAKSDLKDEVRSKELSAEGGEKAVKKSKKDKDVKKEEKIRKEKNDTSPETENGTAPGKHTNVLSKFQKATERSVNIQATAGATPEDADEHQPELHGSFPRYAIALYTSANTYQISSLSLRDSASPHLNTCQPFPPYLTGSPTQSPSLNPPPNPSAN